jgi:pyrimidine-nucleoside phosphorylase
METLEEARELAGLMVDIGRHAGRETVALLSDMNQPLGHAVGNSLEVREALDTLHNGGPADFREHCLHVSAHLLVLGKRAGSLEQGRDMAERVLADDSAFAKFHMLVEAQGGDPSYVDDPSKFPAAPIIEVVNAPRGGYISGIHARTVGEASVTLGAGRAQKGDPVDHAVGLMIHRKVGDKVEKGEPLFTIHANQAGLKDEVKARVAAAHAFSDDPVPPLPLFYE